MLDIKHQQKTSLGFTADASLLKDTDFSIPHHDFDIDCDQKWITHDSQCKFIQPKASEGDIPLQYYQNWQLRNLVITDVTGLYNSI